MVTAGPKPKAKPVAVLHSDSSRLAVRQFNKAYLDSCRQQAEFKYNTETTEPSIWTRFWRWFWHLFDNIEPQKGNLFLGYLVIFLKYLFLLLGAAALIFLILRLAGVDILAIIKRKPATVDVPYAETLENIHEINFDTDIEQAIAQHNFRLAVRLLYLKSLKQLSDAGLINWQIDKTNSTYIDELKNPNQREAFTILTRQFEYVWYGEFAINGQVFQNISTLFNHFKQTLA